MSDVSVTQKRPDADIRADIHHMEKSYPPLANDRHKVKFAVEDGVVTLSGYVKAPPTYNYVINSLKAITGIRSLDHSEFYCDEHLRLHVGAVLPSGVRVMVEYGAVVLTGTPPEGTKVEDIVREVGTVDGVHRVITDFS